MKTRFQFLCLTGVFVAVMLSMCTTAAQADAIAYWRFENSPGFLEDSGPNNMDLTAYDGDSDSAYPTQYTLPGSGAGSYFPDPISQTGQSNAYAAAMTDSHDGFTGADNSALNFSGGFTIEAFFNRDSATYHANLFRHWTGTGNQRSVMFELRKAAYGRVLRLLLSSDGTTYEAVQSSISYTDGKDYYIAAAVDLTGQNVTFYLQNLTDSGSLQTETISTSTSSVYDSSDAFYIGVYNGSEHGTTNDIYDEVRISNVALTQGELLVSVPEPSTLALLACGLIGLLAYAWRKRK